MSTDPFGERGGLNLYGFVVNRSPAAIDPLGLYIEEGKIAKSMAQVKHDIGLAVRAATKEYHKCCYDRLRWDELAPYIDANPSRYVWTNSGGWVDLKHLFATAFTEEPLLIVPSALILWAGEVLVEQAQAEDGAKSAFGVEDLPSNLYGSQFLSTEFGPHRPCEFGDQLERFINGSLGGMGTAPAAVDAYNRIRNFSYEPVISPSGPDIAVDAKTGIPYKGASETSPSAYERKWLDVMHAHGISGTFLGR